MTRTESLSLINNLYGLESGYVEAAIEALGPTALSDRAVEWIAQQQEEEETTKGLWLERVARYQDQHPGLGWNQCEENLRHDVR